MGHSPKINKLFVLQNCCENNEDAQNEVSSSNYMTTIKVN